MNTRIKSVFNLCKSERRVALVAYITGGDPDAKRSFDVACAVVNGGADILELGIPFSDPLADGEANQLAAERAIFSGTTALTVLELISKIRKKFADLPIIIFTYLNPIAFSAEFSFDEFCHKASISGADAILCLDLTPEEDKKLSYSKIMKKYNLGVVSLIAPTTPEARVPKLAKFADSFIYYVSREGVTGESKNFSANFADKISIIRRYSRLPIVVGFGISSPEHVHAAASTKVDGVVVGSAIVRRVEAFSKEQETVFGIEKFVHEFKKGVFLG